MSGNLRTFAAANLTITYIIVHRIMNRTLLFTIALVAAVFAGCTKDSENMAIFTIDTESISLLVNDDYKITPSGVFTARSSDEEVATVSADGVIRGVSAGDADIIFTSVEDGQTQTCKVSVDWRYKYFDEPILDFTMSVEDVKEREIHPFYLEGGWPAAAQGFPDAPDPYLLWFEYNNGITSMFACYKFPDRELHGIAEISIDFDSKFGAEILQQLEERYGSQTESKENKYSKLFFHKKNEYYVRFNPAGISYRKDPFE